MNKAPAFQFYAAEYLADEKVQLMTLDQEGAYIRLISYCWREGSIPNNPEALSLLCKGANKETVLGVIGRFVEHEIDSTRLVHPRLESERRKQSSFRKKMSRFGKIGAQKRYGKIYIAHG